MSGWLQCLCLMPLCLCACVPGAFGFCVFLCGSVGVLGLCLGVLGCDWVWLCSCVAGSCWVSLIWEINVIVLPCCWLKPFAAEKSVWIA